MWIVNLFIVKAVNVYIFPSKKLLVKPINITQEFNSESWTMNGMKMGQNKDQFILLLRHVQPPL